MVSGWHLIYYLRRLWSGVGGESGHADVDEGSADWHIPHCAPSLKA
jgi:hypothetical protein